MWVADEVSQRVADGDLLPAMEAVDIGLCHVHEAAAQRELALDERFEVGTKVRDRLLLGIGCLRHEAGFVEDGRDLPGSLVAALRRAIDDRVQLLARIQVRHRPVAGQGKDAIPLAVARRHGPTKGGRVVVVAGVDHHHIWLKPVVVSQRRRVAGTRVAVGCQVDHADRPRVQSSLQLAF